MRRQDSFGKSGKLVKCIEKKRGGVIVVAGALLIIGLILSFVGAPWRLILAFQENILWGLGALFIPFVGLIFVITHFNKTKKAFFIDLAGIILITIGNILAGGFI